jgi:succinate dehydrogenase cytochrome b556 subunit
MAYSRQRAGHPARPTLETWTWYFLRITGVAMLVLVLGHVFITHYLSLPSETDTRFVAGRWANAFWIAFDWLLLATALFHGLAGLQGVVKDHVHAARWRRLSGTAVALLAGGFFTIGSATLLTGDPSRLNAARGPLSDQVWIGDLLNLLLLAVATATYVGLVVLALYAGRRWAQGWPAGRWAYAGQWAWALHRATGLGILGFLLVHILDVMLLPLAPDIYDRTVASYATPYLIPMEIALVAAVLYHALNGTRLIVLDLVDRPLDKAGLRLQGRLFFAVLALTVALLLPSIVVLLRPTP